MGASILKLIFLSFSDLISQNTFFRKIHLFGRQYRARAHIEHQKKKHRERMIFPMIIIKRCWCVVCGRRMDFGKKNSDCNQPNHIKSILVVDRFLFRFEFVSHRQKLFHSDFSIEF